jgi:hypothetical protein
METAEFFREKANHFNSWLAWCSAARSRFSTPSFKDREFSFIGV